MSSVALASTPAPTTCRESAGPSGYTASAWSCTGGQTGDDPAVTVALGDDITCTITNDDNAPKLT